MVFSTIGIKSAGDPITPEDDSQILEVIQEGTKDLRVLGVLVGTTTIANSIVFNVVSTTKGLRLPENSYAAVTSGTIVNGAIILATGTGSTPTGPLHARSSDNTWRRFNGAATTLNGVSISDTSISGSTIVKYTSTGTIRVAVQSATDDVIPIGGMPNLFLTTNWGTKYPA